jgi:hypothetical protein
MPSKFAICITIGLIVAVSGIGLAVFFARQARLAAELEGSFVPRTLEFRVDLSKPGETTAALTHASGTSSVALRDWGRAYLCLALDPPMKPNEEPGELLQGLSAVLTLSDEEKKDVIQVKIQPEGITIGTDNAVVFGICNDFSLKNYVATLHVVSVAKNLAGRRQKIYAECGSYENEALGFERWFTEFLAIVSGFVGCCAAGFSLLCLVLHGFRRPSPRM